jgi:hypothetical protein
MPLGICFVVYLYEESECDVTRHTTTVRKDKS